METQIILSFSLLTYLPYLSLSSSMLLETVNQDCQYGHLNTTAIKYGGSVILQNSSQSKNDPKFMCQSFRVLMCSSDSENTVSSTDLEMDISNSIESFSKNYFFKTIHGHFFDDSSSM